MDTFLDLLTDSLQSIGQVGIGQSLNAEQSSQGVRVANRMLSKWSIQKLLIPVVATRPFNLSATIQSYTLGPAGTLTGVRPVFVEAGQATVPGSSMQNPLNILDKTQWDALPDKGVVCGPNGIPAGMYVEYTSDTLITLRFSPIPSTAVLITLGTWERLQQFVTVADLVMLQDGYEEAFVANLALELTLYYDMPVSQALGQLAADGLNTIKALNAQKLHGALGESQTLSSPNVGLPPPSSPPGG